MSAVDYTFYKEIYKGADISPYDFDRLSVRAVSYLESIKRCELPDNDSVKMAICSVAEVWQQNEQGGEITSQTVGNWSRSFAGSNKSASQRLFDAARLYIPNLITTVRWV